MRREHTFVAKARCMFPGCWRIEVSRGNCHTHYNGHAADVKAGIRTWEQLEKLGFARPKHPTLREIVDRAVKETA